jgi:hypothetical protein
MSPYPDLRRLVRRGESEPTDNAVELVQYRLAKRLTENELSDFSQLWHDGCVEAIIEAQNVDRNHSAKV